MKELDASLLKNKIFIWRPFAREVDATIEAMLVCAVYSYHSRPASYFRFVNPEGFGNRLLNPYHIFQVRFRDDIVAQMFISMGRQWFKVRDVVLYNEEMKFMNLIAMQVPVDKSMLELVLSADGTL